MTQLDLDPQFVQALRLLHSSSKDSMDQLRSLLDEAIKQKHGISKMLCNVLHKKYTIEEPVLSDQSSCSSKKSKSSSSSSQFSKSDSVEEIPPRDTPPDLLQSDDPLAEILEDDLTCVVCKGMDVGARNRLVECYECHALYHQECHSPPIEDARIDIPMPVWYCSNCIKSYKHVIEKNRGTKKTDFFDKHEMKKNTNQKHTDKYKGSSTSNTSSSSGGAPKIVPNINIIGGDKRFKDSSKKSKPDKRSSSSGKHSSSSPSALSSSKNPQEKSSYKSKSNADS